MNVSPPISPPPPFTSCPGPKQLHSEEQSAPTDQWHWLRSCSQPGFQDTDSGGWRPHSGGESCKITGKRWYKKYDHLYISNIVYNNIASQTVCLWVAVAVSVCVCWSNQCERSKTSEQNLLYLPQLSVLLWSPPLLRSNFTHSTLLQGGEWKTLIPSDDLEQQTTDRRAPNWKSTQNFQASPSSSSSMQTCPPQGVGGVYLEACG